MFIPSYCEARVERIFRVAFEDVAEIFPMKVRSLSASNIRLSSDEVTVTTAVMESSLRDLPYLRVILPPSSEISYVPSKDLPLKVVEKVLSALNV